MKNKKLSGKQIAISSWILVALLNLIFFQALTPLSIFYALSCVFVLSLFTWLELSLVKRYRWSIPLMALVLMLLGASLAIRASNVAQLLALVGTSATTGLSLYLVSRGRPSIDSLMELMLVPFRLAIDVINSLLLRLEEVSTFLFSKKDQTSTEVDIEKKKLRSTFVRSLIIGFVLGIPPVALLIYQFSQADPIFAQLIIEFITNFFTYELVRRIVFSLVLFIPAYILFGISGSNTFSSPFTAKDQRPLVVEFSVAMTMVAATIAIFLSIQWPYIFAEVGKHASLEQYGISTFSQYVRRGFWELLLSSGIIVTLIWSGLLVFRGSNQKAPYLRAVQLVVLAELGIFLLSIYRRVWLYQYFHGWTIARLYGVAILILFSGLALTLALRHFFKWRWVTVEIFLLGAFVVAVSFFNPEQYILNSGHLPTVNEQVDYVYLAQMTPDGYQGWDLALKYADATLTTSQLPSSAESGSIINADARQEIAYSGLILTTLTQHYHDLLLKHGSEQEILAVVQLIYDQDLQEFTTAKQQLESTLAITNRNLETIENYSVPNQSEIRTKIMDLQRNLESAQDDLADYEPILDVIATKLAQNQPVIIDSDVDSQRLSNTTGLFFVEPEELHGNFTFNKNYECVGYKPEVCDIIRFNDNRVNFLYLERFVDRDFGTTHLEPAGFLDLVFNYNQAEIIAYQFLRDEVTFQKLLDLNSRYTQLSDIIISQPENEQAYDVEIDINRPFDWK